MDRRQPPRHRRAPIERHCNSFNSRSSSLARAAASAVESLEARQLLSGTPPTLTIDGPAAVNEGSTYTLSLSASAGANLTNWAVNWGDGTTDTLAGGATAATHAYADGPNGYTITATGTNADGTFNAIHPAAGGGGGTVNGGALDVTFGAGGKVVGPAGLGGPVLVQPDGKILVGGMDSTGSDFLLVRYNADGSLDATFGNGGVVSTDFGASDQINALTLETVQIPDPLNPGQTIPQTYVVAAGESFIGFNQNGRFALARYNLADGSLDTTFGAGGKVLTQFYPFNTDDQARSVAINPVNGDIVVGGTIHESTGSGDFNGFALASYLPNGSLDASFGPAHTGLVAPDANALFGSHQALSAIAVLPDGRILAAGQVAAPVFDGVLVRFNADGTLDSTFGNNGIADAGPGNGQALSVLSDGRVIMAGYNGSGAGISVERFTSAGAIDTSYGNNGSVVTVIPNNGLSGMSGLVVQPDGSAVVGATVYNTTSDFALFRFTPAGAADATFGTGGAVYTDVGNSTIDAVTGLALDASGRVVVAGRSYTASTSTWQFALARYGANQVATTPLAVQVANVAPSVTLGTPTGTLTEGSLVSLTATVTDPGPLDNPTAAWTVTDSHGNAVASGAGTAITFTPADNGAYVVTLTATDKDGGVGSASTTVNVANVAPTVTLGAPAGTLNEGSPVSLTGTMTDPGINDAPVATWTVANAAGVTVASGNSTAITFTPADNGAYVVTLTATDKDGGSSSTSRTVNVANVAPTLKLGGDTSGVRGQNRTLTLTAADPSTADAAAGFTYVINWGDGTTQTVHSGATATVIHAYALDWVYHVTATTTDKDGGRSAATAEDMTILPWQIQGRTLAIGGLTADDLIILTENKARGTQTIKLSDDILFGASFDASQFDTIALYQSDAYGIVVAHSLTVAVELVNADGSVLETLFAGK